jgi:hypothetical protein
MNCRNTVLGPLLSAVLLSNGLLSTFVMVGCDANDPAPPRSSPTAVKDSGGAYPDGPYGVKNGTVIADISWDGWREPKASQYDPALFETISLSDYYDPDGEKGLHAIFVNASARWCSICKLEQRHIREMHEQWGPRGVVFIEALFEDVESKPAKPEDLVSWGKMHEVDWVFVADPINKLGLFFDRSASPMNMIINAKTMEIRDIITGMPDNSWWTSRLEPLISD